VAVTKPFWTKRLDAIAGDDPIYPNMAFEEWYRQGLECFLWNLPRALVRQAFHALVKDRRRYWGSRIAPWQIRAFVYGLRGGYDERNVCRAPGYVWPMPDDPAWQFVVFVYRDGFATVDWLHPVSRRFWSEDNGPLELPPHQPGELDGDWLRSMGFDVLWEWAPSATVRVDPASATPALRP
jgi:hypothetical protein